MYLKGNVTEKQKSTLLSMIKFNRKTIVFASQNATNPITDEKLDRLIASCNDGTLSKQSASDYISLFYRNGYNPV